MNRQSIFQAKKESQPLQTSSLFRRQAAQAPVEEREPAALPVNLGRDFSGIPFKPVHPAPALGPSSISCPFTPQRCPFGGVCHACPPKMQAKLKIGQPGDKYEQEADRVAEQVMRMPEPQVQRKCSAPGCKDEEEKKLLQTKPASAGEAGTQVDHPLIQNVLSSSGQPLDAGTRSFMEPRFGQDFSGVRVHTDGQAAESARAVNARAYTVGRDVVFGEGQYAPGSDEGKRLVAHELAHVGQQLNKFKHQDRNTIQLQANSHTQRDHQAAPTANDPLGAALSLPVLEQIRAEATVRSFRLGAYTARGLHVVDMAKYKMINFSRQYTDAYQTYADVMRTARAEAQNQQQWIDVFAGIAIGVGVGLLSGAIVGEATLSTLSSVLVESVGEGIEAGTAAAAHRLIPPILGQELEPGGIHPGLIQSGIWQTLSRLYRTLAQVQRIGLHLPLLLGNTEYAIGQLRLIEAGVQADMTQAEFTDMAMALVNVNRSLQGLDREIQMRMGQLEQLNTQLNSSPRCTQNEIEQNIWIVWIAALHNDQSDILDLDAIEDHLQRIGVLGNSSRFGFGFGRWTSKDDEIRAIATARNEANTIRRRFNAITLGSSDGM